MLIVFSKINSYQASVARLLVESGAHLAMVGGQKNNKLQISLRSNRDFYESSTFHLGKDLAKPLGYLLEGMGGGHSKAAGINGVGEFDFAVKKAVQILQNKLMN